jgi:hypothetical protein
MLRANAHHNDADERNTAISQHLDCAGNGLQRGTLFKKCILVALVRIVELTIAVIAVTILTVETVIAEVTVVKVVTVMKGVNLMQVLTFKKLASVIVVTVPGTPASRQSPHQ